jgi:thymidine phosphorylase
VDPRELIRQKRDGGTHDASALSAFITAYARGEVADYQASAWLMAAFLKGLDEAETQALTRALLDSGRRFDWSALGAQPTSTRAAAGDKISHPRTAGRIVRRARPMVSGAAWPHRRHAGSLESIPGSAHLRPTRCARARRDGRGDGGAGPISRPADGSSTPRDVTATVEYEPFIVASIVSKKIAEAGLPWFTTKRATARSCEPECPVAARRLVSATRAWARAAAFITDMSQRLRAWRATRSRCVNRSTCRAARARR